MIAGRRTRRRTLIRSTTMTSAIAKNLTAVGGLVRRRQDPDSKGQSGGRQDGNAGKDPYLHQNVQQSLSESMMYLQQLSRLHAAGILTDEEFQLARGRLFGS